MLAAVGEFSVIKRISLESCQCLDGCCRFARIGRGSGSERSIRVHRLGWSVWISGRHGLDGMDWQGRRYRPERARWSDWCGRWHRLRGNDWPAWTTRSNRAAGQCRQRRRGRSPGIYRVPGTSRSDRRNRFERTILHSLFVDIVLLVAARRGFISTEVQRINHKCI